MRVDLNCDMGEGFGRWRAGDDDALLTYVTSANIACGFHAGDPAQMRRLVGAASARGVAIGAHPGLPDLAGFGRRPMDVSPAEVYDMVVYQVGALRGFTDAAGVRLAHVKPHGALYNMAAVDDALADAIARAVRDVDPGLILFGLAHSALISAAQRLNLASAAEAFADRAYEYDGTLTPRSEADAVITDPAAAGARAVRMVTEQLLTARDGTSIGIQPATICIHGDGATAVEMAAAVRAALERASVSVIAPAADAA